MKMFNTTLARKNFSEIINQVKYQGITIRIGRRNKTEALIVPATDFDDDIPITEINANSKSFKFLEDEPEIYSLDDIKVKYV